MKYDIGVIGGGVIGLVSAWRMAQRGASVAVFERGEIGSEASCAAAGMLAPYCEAARYPPAQGRDAARRAMLDLCLRSRALYPAFAAELQDATGTDIELCASDSPATDWRTHGFHYFATDAADAALAGFRAQQDSGGAVFARSVDEMEPAMRELINADAVGPYFFDLPKEGQVENRRMLMAMMEAAGQAGVSIHEYSDVQSIIRQDDKATGIRTSQGDIACGKVLIAAGSWSNTIGGVPIDAVPPVRPLAGQMISLRGPCLIPRVVYSTRVYMVPRRDGRLLVGATMEECGYTKPITDEGRDLLLREARHLIPRIAELDLEAHWSGLRPAPHDGLPTLGATQIENLYAAAGHFRNGILLTPVTGELMARCLLDNEAPPREFSAQRGEEHSEEPA